jgi:hypothetical protein
VKAQVPFKITHTITLKNVAAKMERGRLVPKRTGNKNVTYYSNNATVTRACLACKLGALFDQFLYWFSLVIRKIFGTFTNSPYPSKAKHAALHIALRSIRDNANSKIKS